MNISGSRPHKPQICVIGNSRFSQLLHSVIPEFEPLASISIVDDVFNDAVQAARDLIEQQKVDVVLSAGASAACRA